MNRESFPANFISAFLSADIYSKSCFHAYEKQMCESFPYIMIKSNELQNFSPT